MLAVGVLPYPLTFLCTDLISEFYGRRRANWVVTVGLIINFWVVFILWLGGVMPQVPPLDPATGLPAPPENLSMVDGRLVDQEGFAFYQIREANLWGGHGLDDRLSPPSFVMFTCFTFGKI